MINRVFSTFTASVLAALLAIAVTVHAQEPGGSKLFNDDDPVPPPPAKQDQPPSIPAGSGVNLLEVLDPTKDAVVGKWSRNEAGELVSGREALAHLEIPYRPPAEYDYVIEFTQRPGGDEVAQLLSVGERSFGWFVGCRGGKLGLFGRLNGKGLARDNPTLVDTRDLATPGRRHTSVVSVRQGELSAWLDGKLLHRRKTADYSEFTMSPYWALRTPAVLGVGSNHSATSFHRIELFEVTGRGGVVERVAVPTPAPTPPTAPATSPTTSNAPAIQLKPPPPPADGRGLLAELYADVRFTKKVAARYDPELDFVFGQGSPGTGLPIDRFAVRWTGFLRAPAPGAYRIKTYADNSLRVWLDEKPIIEKGDWQAIIVELTDQPHALRVEYVEHTGWAGVTLQWRPPGEKHHHVIPPDFLFHDRAAAEKARFGPRAPKPIMPKGAGVETEIYSGHNFEGRAFKRIDRQIDGYWGGEAVGPDLPADNLSIRFKTWLKAPKPGAYKLIVHSDDGVRLWLDGRQLIDQWQKGHFRNEALVDLTDKPHAIRLEYYEDQGDARVSLHWEQVGGFQNQIIPPEAFFTDRAAATKGSP